MAEVQSNLTVPRGMVEKVAEDLSRERWEVEPSLTMLLVDLVEVEVEVLTDMEGVQEEEDTLEEAVEIMRLIRVEAVEGLIMLEKINKTNVAINHLAMVR